MAHLEYCSNCGKKNTYGNCDGHVRHHCEHCGSIHYENPKPTATLICPRENTILLVKRAFEPAKGEWSLPGGFMELNETPQEAGIRELKEETNLDCRIGALLGHCSHHKTVFGDVLLLAMIANVSDFSNLQCGDDASEAGFYALDKIPPLAFECHEKIVAMYRNHIGVE